MNYLLRLCTFKQRQRKGTYMSHFEQDQLVSIIVYPVYSNERTRNEYSFNLIVITAMRTSTNCVVLMHVL